MKLKEWRLHLIYGKSAFETSFDSTDDVWFCLFSKPVCLFPCQVTTNLIYIMPVITAVSH